MTGKRIKVTVVKYRDRPNLVLRWFDHAQQKYKTKSSGCTRRREAERVAAQLERELIEAKDSGPPPITWDEFKQTYQDDCLSSLSDATYRITSTTFKHVERILKPTLLTDLTGPAIATWQTRLRAEGLADATVGVHSRHLKASLRWAHDMELLETVPKVKLPKKAQRPKMKGRAITLEEYERMLDKTASVVGVDAAPSWKRLLTGLWLSGLRISEAVNLSWDADAPVSICLDNKSPCFKFRAEGQKAGRDELAPMAPDFVMELVLTTPHEEQTGRVFRPESPTGASIPLSARWASRTICKIGKAANAVVERGTRKGEPHIKYASAHDFRRAFGLRWSKLVMPPALMQLMRHSDIKTTMKFYVGRNVDDAAEQLRAAFGTVTENVNKSVTSADSARSEEEVENDETNCFQG